jgi:hypothetical protein
MGDSSGTKKAIATKPNVRGTAHLDKSHMEELRFFGE